jgi:hypothetical protein
VLAFDEKNIDEGSEKVSDIRREEIECVEGIGNRQHRQGSKTASIGLAAFGNVARF